MASTRYSHVFLARRTLAYYRSVRPRPPGRPPPPASVPTLAEVGPERLTSQLLLHRGAFLRADVRSMPFARHGILVSASETTIPTPVIYMPDNLLP